MSRRSNSCGRMPGVGPDEMYQDKARRREPPIVVRAVAGSSPVADLTESRAIATEAVDAASSPVGSRRATNAASSISGAARGESVNIRPR